MVVDQLVNQVENKIQLSSNLATHTNYRFIKNINMKTKICRKTLQWLLFGKDLRTQTTATMKKRVKFYFIKIKNSYSWNVTSTRQTQGMPVTDWGLVHRLYENHLQISNKKTKSHGNVARYILIEEINPKHKNTIERLSTAPNTSLDKDININ